MNEKVIKQFHGLALLISYNGMLRPLLREAFPNCPSELTTASSVFTWRPSILHSSTHLRRPRLEITSSPLPSRLWLPWEQGLFLFSLFISSSASSGVPDSSRGFNNCLLNWSTWFALRGHLFRDWCLMGYPRSERVEGDRMLGGSFELSAAL